MNAALCDKINLFNVAKINKIKRVQKKLNGEDKRNISAHVAYHRNGLILFL